METLYLCPHCRGRLSMHQDIVLIAKKNNKKGFIFLRSTFGNYQSKVDATLYIREGEMVEFMCPLCHSNLSFEKDNKKLTHLKFISKANRETDIYFSRISGNHRAYQVENSEMVYFEEPNNSINPDWYLG